MNNFLIKRFKNYIEFIIRMLHLNSEKDKDFALFFIDLIFPETYIATSIDDFLKNKSGIKPTKKVLPLGVFLYNQALIEFPEGVYNSLDEKTGIISDCNSSININLDGIWGIDKEKRVELKENMRLYDILTVYKPKDDSIWLSGYKTHGPISTSENKELKFELGNLRFCPA